MKVPVGWLREFVPNDWGAEKVADAFSQLGLNVESLEKIGSDFVLDLETPSNRSDVLGVYGCAREFAAYTGHALKSPELAPPGAPRQPLKIEIADPTACRRYAGLYAEVGVKASPAWVQARLEQCGLRPINGIVDLTNYVLLEFGQPLHAFDFAKIGGSRVIIRRARAGERLLMLDGVERELRDSDLVIADAARPMALAGVMGGEATGVNAFTKAILLESAYFDPPTIRRTAKAHGISTDASYRFERDVDPNGIPLAAQRFAHLLAATGLGRPDAGYTDVHPSPFTEVKTTYRPAKAARVLGFDIPLPAQQSALKALGFDVRAGTADWHVTVPSWRRDVTIEEDLIEEVVRMNGYHQVPDLLQDAPLSIGKPAGSVAFERSIRDVLAGFGLVEAVNLPLLPEGLYAGTDASVPPSGRGGVRVLAPLSLDQSVLRPSLLPGLLQVLKLNQSRSVPLAGIFEVGRTWKKVGDTFIEERSLAIALPETIQSIDWRGTKPLAPDFFTVKGLIETLLATFGTTAEFRASAPGDSWFHPSRHADIVIGNRVIGRLCEIHPAIVQRFDLGGRAWYAELDISGLIAERERAAGYITLPIHPAISRDMAIVAPVAMPQKEIEAAIRANAGEWLESLALFDVYSGKNIASGHRSLAYHLVFRHPDRTLADEEVNRCERAVINALKSLGLSLRES